MKSFKSTLVIVMIVLLLGILGFANKAKAQINNGNHVAQVREADAKIALAEVEKVKAVAGIPKALAEANEINARALKTLEEARSLAIDNSLKYAKTFWEKKTLRSLQEAPSRATKEDLIRYSRVGTPEPLTEKHFNPVKKEIYWPAALQSEEFDLHRMQIEDIFNKRPGYTKDALKQLQETTNQMKVELLSLVKTMPPADYMEAKKFVHSLAYEPEFDSGLQERIGSLVAK